MALIIYVIRSSEPSLARSICLKRRSEVVLSLGNTLPPGRIEHTTAEVSLDREETLSYEQALTLLLGADKVIAL